MIICELSVEVIIQHFFKYILNGMFLKITFVYIDKNKWVNGDPLKPYLVISRPLFLGNRVLFVIKTAIPNL